MDHTMRGTSIFKVQAQTTCHLMKHHEGNKKRTQLSLADDIKGKNSA